MQSEMRIKLLMLISTFLAQINHRETTKKIDKLRKQCRYGNNKFLTKVGEKEYLRVAKEASEVWESAKHDLDRPAEFAVPLNLAIIITYDMLDEKGKTLWFSQTTFENAMGSLSYGFTPGADIEANATWLLNKFRERLGLKPKQASVTLAQKIALMKKNKEFNDILEGK